MRSHVVISDQRTKCEQFIAVVNNTINSHLFSSTRLEGTVRGQR